MVVAQGETWWADLPEPSGSGPGFRRPVIVVQGDAFNRSRIDTIGLAKDSVANVSQIVTLDRASLTERVGKLSRAKLELVLYGIDVLLGR
jgi:mRNA interferase MazF